MLGASAGRGGPEASLSASATVRAMPNWLTIRLMISPLPWTRKVAAETIVALITSHSFVTGETIVVDGGYAAAT